MSSTQTADVRFDAAMAAQFAALALANIEREYPNQPGHVWQSAADARVPSALHPAFYGSYDWHSSVHMHWLLARIRRLYPTLAACEAIRVAFERHFSVAAIGQECAYLDQPGTGTFERTYGWAWLLKLADELARSDDADARRWTQALAPLAQRFVARYVDYLPRADYAIRHGTHANSAFGLVFAHEYALRSGDDSFQQLLEAKAIAWFAGDRNVPAAWEPSGADFLSPALMEALLMRRVLPLDAFRSWFPAYLPGFSGRLTPARFQPVQVRDRSDPQIVHLDGLNLSRAWCLRGIAMMEDAAQPWSAVAAASAQAHLVAGMQGLASADYGGSHWLASFAALALTDF